MKIPDYALRRFSFHCQKNLIHSVRA